MSRVAATRNDDLRSADGSAMVAQASPGICDMNAPPPMSIKRFGPAAGSSGTGANARLIAFQLFSATTTGYSESRATFRSGGGLAARNAWNGAQSDSSVYEMMSSMRRLSGRPRSLTAFIA